MGNIHEKIEWLNANITESIYFTVSLNRYGDKYLFNAFLSKPYKECSQHDLDACDIYKSKLVYKEKDAIEFITNLFYQRKKEISKEKFNLLTIYYAVSYDKLMLKLVQIDEYQKQMLEN